MTPEPAPTAPDRHRAAPLGVSQIQLSTPDLDRFGRFYTDVLGLRATVVLRQSQPPHRRHAMYQVGDTAAVLHVLEIRDPEPDAGDHRAHLGFLVTDREALDDLATRLRACGASDGQVHFAGPYLSVHYRDPDGADGEVNCPNPDFAIDVVGACTVEGPADTGWLGTLASGSSADGSARSSA